MRGPEDENTADFGNDPIGVIERCEDHLSSHLGCSDGRPEALTRAVPL